MNVVATSNDEVVGFYMAFFGEIFAFCVRRLFSKDLAEDATSKVFLRFIERYPSLDDKSKRVVRNWLYGTASNVIAKHFRDAKHRRMILEEVARRDRFRENEALRDENRLDWPVLYGAIGTLKQRHQEILVLRYFQGLETSAIAEVFGMKDVTVRVQLSRAVKKLKRKLGKAFGAPYETN